VVTALLLVGIYVGFRWSLSGASDTLAASIAGLRVAAPVAPPRPALEPRLAPFLAEEIRRGLVAVDDRPDAEIVRVAEIIGGHDARAKRTVRLDGFAVRHRGRA